MYQRGKREYSASEMIQKTSEEQGAVATLASLEEKPSNTLECLLGLSTQIGWNSPESKKLIQPLWESYG